MFDNPDFSGTVISDPNCPKCSANNLVQRRFNRLAPIYSGAATSSTSPPLVDDWAALP